jgi:magnesium chelatase family protein
MNPCPCGHAGDTARACVCAAADVLRYRARLSGPLADRIDLHVQVPPVSIERLATCEQGERSPSIRDRVEAARRRQRIRYRDDTCNARAPGRWLDSHGGLERSARALLGGAAERLHLSARAFHRVLRVARTIADLEASEGIIAAHVAEALGYRPRMEDAVAAPIVALRGGD